MALLRAFAHVRLISPALANALLPSYATPFALGIAMAILLAALNGCGTWRRPPRWPMYGLALLWMVASQVTPDIVAPGLVLMGWTTLLAAVVFGSDPAKQALNWAPFRWLGLVSYGIYLWHATLIDKLMGLGVFRGPSALYFPLNVAIALGFTLLAASFSYYVIERPALKLKPRTERSPLPQTSTAHYERRPSL